MDASSLVLSPTSPSRFEPPGRAQAPSTAPAQRLLDALPAIEAVVSALGRRYRLSPDEREELLGCVRLRLIEDDYAVLRRFEGRSRLSTYLRTVITRMFLDQRVRAWGRWRPSARVVRLGPTAVALERLVERQHLPAEQAIETLRATGTDVDVDDLRALARQVPRRAGRRFVDDSVLEQLPAPGSGPDALVAHAGTERLQAKVSHALRGVTALLAPRMRLLLRMRYVHGTSVAAVSRTLGCEQKPLYRELEGALRQLRRDLEARGISSAQVRALIAAGPTRVEGNPIG